MKKKQWLLLLSGVLLLAGYFKFFFKTWSNNMVSSNADCVVALDVKRITNTLIWNYLTTPSQWKNISLFSSKKELSLDDIINVPDYVFIFHNQGEPLNAWYTVATIKNEADFEKGLKQYHFEKQGTDQFVSNDAGLILLRSGKQLLLGNAGVSNRGLIEQTAAAIFSRRYIDKNKLHQLTDQNSHAAMQVFNTSFNQYVTAARINFDKKSLNAVADLSLPASVVIPARKFTYCDTSMCVIGCAQPQQSIQHLLDSSTRSLFSKAVNFDVDSLFVNNNHFYQLEIEEIHSRMDSAISYTYDNNFNPVENKVINSVEEPAFIFSVVGKASADVFHYWRTINKLEHTAEGELFTPVPFVKSYCRMPSADTLLIVSNNYRGLSCNQSIEAIAFLNILVAKIPPSCIKYLPGTLVKALNNFETVRAGVFERNNKHFLEISCSKKENELPIFSLD